MPIEGSLKESMDKAVKRYSSLFRLPSDREVLVLSALSCFLGGLLSAISLSISINGIAWGLLLGLGLFFIGLMADYTSSLTILARGTIYNLRRIIALSFFSWLMWLFFIFLGSGLAISFGSNVWWIRLCLLGFSAVMMFRLVVFSSTATMSQSRILVASLIHPLSCLAPFIGLWFGNGNVITLSMIAFFFVSIIVGLTATSAFLYSIDRLGKQTLGMRSLSLFRAFMLNWVLSLNEPFEQLLEKLGEKKDVEACIVKFSSLQERVVMAIPSIHPGPFKNIGSSLLPSMLKAALESQLSCVAAVPHGLLGHEFDLASQQQNQRIIEHVVAEVKALRGTETTATEFVKVTNGLATACCQVFGTSALISLTLAPKTIEDLPQELGLLVREEAEKRGLDFCAVVNAHNSIDGTAELQESLDSLKDAAKKCLEKVATLKQSTFRVGAATIIPKEFTLEDGMGPGGITVIVVECGGQKAAYVVVDGNNMISGLREDILSSLSLADIDDGEVFTTDTHSVSALVLGEQGYHPVGEAMDTNRLKNYILEASRSAISSLKSMESSCRSITVNDVTVLGAKQLETMCLLIDRSVQTAKRIVAPIFVTAGALLMFLLLFI